MLMRTRPTDQLSRVVHHSNLIYQLIELNMRMAHPISRLPTLKGYGTSSNVHFANSRQSMAHHPEHKPKQYLGFNTNECETSSNICMTKSKLGFYVPFNSQGHIGTGPQNCHLWDSNPHR